MRFKYLGGNIFGREADTRKKILAGTSWEGVTKVTPSYILTHFTNKGGGGSQKKGMGKEKRERDNVIAELESEMELASGCAASEIAQICGVFFSFLFSIPRSFMDSSFLILQTPWLRVGRCRVDWRWRCGAYRRPSPSSRSLHGGR